MERNGIVCGKNTEIYAGRYGADELGQVLNIVALVCIVLSMFFTRIPAFKYAIVVGRTWSTVYTWFRMFSKNVQKRYDENQIIGRFVIGW